MKNLFPNYDIIVVGAGHAGCEAASASANMGARVLLVTMNMMNVAQMSCNPSIGGIAKGQIVREIDALGGLTGIITDRTTIQFRMLNRSKGPAMWSPRAQNDRIRFSWEWRKELEAIKEIDFWQDSVKNIIVKKGKVAGIITSLGIIFYAKAVILANGTFLNGTIHIGEKKFNGGRIGENASLELTENLVAKGFESFRMKTGTPVRVDGRSLDFKKMEEQKGDKEPGKFSFDEEIIPVKEQRSCYLTYTNSEVHEILRKGFDRSPLFTGRIKGRGPRYCPSIEDKIERFSSRERHQLFVEPEGLDTVEYYVNGFSSSLPEEIQFAALRKVPGFKKARFFRPGYAIEYDYFPPCQLHLNLETKIIENLFFAGQINGTTGYEEAAGQGLMAGINAYLKINDGSSFILKRSEAYIGVLIDDLVTKGTEEPYRMFTSRAEYRILLRQDNADIRLTPKGYELGLLNDRRYRNFKEKREQVLQIISNLKKYKIQPTEVNGMLEGLKSATIKQKISAANLLLRPQVGLKDLLPFLGNLENEITRGSNIKNEILEEAEIMIKYEQYIDKEAELAEKLSELEKMKLDKVIDYMAIDSLSMEAREKLTRHNPETIGQASRISGISPADISVLIVLMNKQ